MNKKISDKDIKDWNEFLSKNERLTIKDDELIKKDIPETLTFDLHGYSLKDANKKVRDIIQMSHESGIKKLILITGKGIHSQNEKDPYVSKDLGILKNSVPDFIKNNKGLMGMINEISDAKIIDGGGGAFYIFLKKKPTK